VPHAGAKDRGKRDRLSGRRRATAAVKVVTARGGEAMPLDIDVRGMRAVEAEEALERYLNDAYLASLPSCGSSTARGPARCGSRSAISGATPPGRRFEGSKDNMGGEGVTVARLRQD
jgi:dsDNA-specific endonuclease/ATPase MutS2